MAEYRIPLHKEKAFLKSMEKLKKASDDFSLVDKGEEIVNVPIYVDRMVKNQEGKYEYQKFFETTKPIKCKVYDCSGTIRNKGFTYLGKIEFRESQDDSGKDTTSNVIIPNKFYSREVKIPDKFRTSKPICEHCGITRKRSDTYLIYNEETKEIKQVGSTCLLEYTGGLDANSIATLNKVQQEDYFRGFYEFSEEDYKKCFGRDGMYNILDSDRVIYSAYISILEDIKPNLVNGKLENAYAKDRLANKLDWYAKSYADNVVMKYIFEKPIPDIDEKLVFKIKDSIIKKLDEKLKNNEIDDNEYKMYKAIITGNWIEGRDYPTLIKFFSFLLKDEAKQDREKEYEQNALNTKYVGNIGEKVSFTIKEVKVIFTHSPYRYGGVCSYTYSIKDENGYVYLWTTTKDITLNDIGSKITGTIKDLSEFRGAKQNVITRCSIEPKPVEVKTEQEIKPVSVEEQVDNYLDDFFENL